MARIGKSNEEKARAGNAGHRAPRAPLVQPPSGSLAPPSWLKDRVALALWHRVAKDLHGLRWLSSVDVDVFGRWCLHFSQWLDSNRKIKREGEIIDTPMTGHTEENPKFMKRANPRVRIREMHESRLLEIEDRFGLSAVSKFRILAAQSVHGRSLGGLFDEPGDDDAADEAQPAAAVGAFGFLSHPARPN